MPLSEEEQRVLAEIERQLRDTEPEFALRFGSIPTPPPAGRPWAAVGGLAFGLLLVLFTFQRYFVLAFAGFVVMVVSGVGLTLAVRQILHARLVALAQRSRNRPVSPPFPLRRRPMQPERGEPPFSDEI